MWQAWTFHRLIPAVFYLVNNTDKSDISLIKRPFGIKL
jgi:hypothetical protein